MSTHAEMCRDGQCERCSTHVTFNGFAIPKEMAPPTINLGGPMKATNTTCLVPGFATAQPLFVNNALGAGALPQPEWQYLPSEMANVPRVSAPTVPLFVSRLHPEDVDRIARRVVELLKEAK